MSSSQHDHLGFRVAYDGSAFSGFQAQTSHRSVQSELEHALKTVLGFKGRIHYTSRTDTGVHAIDQWIVLPHAFSYWADLTTLKRKRLRISLNALLKGHSSFWQALRIKSGFQTKYHVDSKRYEYLILEGRSIVPLMRRSHWWIRSTLDVPSIRRNLKLIEGKNDFRSFSNRQRAIKQSSSTVRNMTLAQLSVDQHPFGKGHRILRFEFQSSGFLYHMVRNLVGTLVEIGLGKRDSVSPLLSRTEKVISAKIAPANGLTLVETFIDPDWYEVLHEF